MYKTVNTRQHSFNLGSRHDYQGQYKKRSSFEMSSSLIIMSSRWTNTKRFNYILFCDRFHGRKNLHVDGGGKVQHWDCVFIGVHLLCGAVSHHTQVKSHFLLHVSSRFEGFSILTTCSGREITFSTRMTRTRRRKTIVLLIRLTQVVK